MKPLKLCLSSLLFLAMSGAVTAAPLFFDSFESGDLSKTNSEGFRWLSPNKTSVVSSEAIDGSRTLRFLYPATNYMSEQRFDLGGAYRDIWFQYWLRVPTNYSHAAENPTNRKLFALWMDGYSSKGNGPTIAWEFWRDSGGGSIVAFHYSAGGYKVMGPHLQYTPFISVPGDRGRWMEITLHVKASSNSTSEDGVIEMWRRWQGESDSQRKLIHRTTNADIAAPSGGPNGWAAGYIMGWANVAYSQDTQWLLDSFTVSTSSLLDSSGGGASGGVPPAAPNLRLEQ